MATNKICIEAIQTFGADSQKWMAIEEMAELANALAKYKRGRVGCEEVITEIADVIIMMDQMTYIFGEDEVYSEIRRKLDRLHDRIESARETERKKIFNINDLLR